jgi:hypothetical protein
VFYQVVFPGFIIRKSLFLSSSAGKKTLDTELLGGVILAEFAEAQGFRWHVSLSHLPPPYQSSTFCWKLTLHNIDDKTREFQMIIRILGRYQRNRLISAFIFLPRFNHKSGYNFIP